MVSVSDAFCENEAVPWSLQFDAALGLLVLHAGGKPAHVAQLVEHVLGKDEVTGSIPVMGSSNGLAAGAVKIQKDAVVFKRGKSDG